MAERKQMLSSWKADEELLQLLERSRAAEVDEATLQEQRVSFAYGNGMARDDITKESVRRASQHIRIRS